MVDIGIVSNYRSKTNFMEIVDVDLFNTIYTLYQNNELQTINNALPLKVIQDKGIEVKPDFEVKVTDLNTDTKNLKYKQFSNNGDGGITFKVDVIIKKGATWGYGVETKGDYIFKGKVYPSVMKVTTWINYWYVNMRPLYVVSDAIDIPNGTYVLTDNSARKQDYKEYTVWTLEFTTFRPLELWRWGASQSVITATTPKKTTSTSTSSSSINTKLKNCIGKIKYSKTKKVVECNKTLQTKLYNLGFLTKAQIDGWYGDVTMNAVKKFQKYHNKKGGNLLVDGVAGKYTVTAMCKY